MVQNQPAPTWSRHPLRNPIEVMLAGFRQVLLLRVPSLVKPLAFFLGHPISPSNQDRQISPMPENSMQVKENLPPLSPEKIILHGELDRNE